MSASAKQKLCSKLGISENQLVGNNLFKTNQINSSKNLNIKNDKGEKAIKFFTSANVDKKKVNLGTSAYQNFKIDILVPNNEPPRPLTNLDTAKNTYLKCNQDGNIFSSPTRKITKTLASSFTNSRKGNATNLENLNHSIKLSNTDIYSPLNRAKNSKQNEFLGKYFN